MVDYTYKLDLDEPVQMGSRFKQEPRKGIGAQPKKEEPEADGWGGMFWSLIKGYFGDEDEANKALGPKQPSTSYDMDEALETLKSVSRISEPVIEGAPEKFSMPKPEPFKLEVDTIGNEALDRDATRLVDVTDTEEGKLDNVKPLEELAEAIDPGTIDTESLDADGGASTSGKGLMSRPITPEQREALLEMGDITKAQQFSIESDGSFSKQKLTDVVDSSVGNLNKRAALEGMVDVEIGSTGPRTEDSYSLENLANFTGAWRQRSIDAGLLDQNGRPTQLAQDLNSQGQLGDTIFNVQYAGRNGNGDIESGDGSTFKGRGLVQLTGRGNYQAVQDILQAQGIDVDLINNPELVNDNRYALPAALAYLEHSGFTDEAADNMSARSLQLAINPSAPVETAEERWEAAISSLRTEDPEAADEMEKRNEYAAQRTVGTPVDGIIGEGSITAMRGWLQENNIAIPEDATNMDLVVLVNENA